MAKKIKSTCFCQTVGYGSQTEAESNHRPEIRADACCQACVVEE